MNSCFPDPLIWSIRGPRIGVCACYICNRQHITLGERVSKLKKYIFLEEIILCPLVISNDLKLIKLISYIIGQIIALSALLNCLIWSIRGPRIGVCACYICNRQHITLGERVSTLKKYIFLEKIILCPLVISNDLKLIELFFISSARL